MLPQLDQIFLKPSKLLSGGEILSYEHDFPMIRSLLYDDALLVLPREEEQVATSGRYVDFPAALKAATSLLILVIH